MPVLALTGPLVVATMAAAATTDLAPPLASLAGIALALLAGGYVLACRMFPFRACPTCRGRGVQPSRGLFGGLRDCPACTGTGTRLRRGLRLWLWLRRRSRRRR